jgi:hypothetical protein
MGDEVHVRIAPGAPYFTLCRWMPPLPVCNPKPGGEKMDLSVMNDSIKRLAVVLTMAALAGPSLAGVPSPDPTSWELSGQFQNVSNPAGPGTGTPSANGVWHYGFRLPAPIKSGGFTCPTYFTNQVNQTSYAGWDSGNPLPLVGQNTATVPLLFGNPLLDITIPARGVQMHPGYGGERAMVEFRAPAAALYRVNGQFYGLDANGSATQTNVSVWKQEPQFGPCVSSLVFAGPIRLSSTLWTLPAIQQASFAGVLVMLQKNQKLFFEVAPGPNNNIQYGSTGLHAVIQRAGDYCSGIGSASDC